MRLFSYVRVTALLTMAAATACADVLHVTESGVFSSTTPYSFFSSPGGAYSFTFDIGANPIAQTSDDEYFTVAVSNFNYTLNDQPIGISPVLANFYSSSVDGLISLCLDSTTCGFGPENGFNMGGLQAFAGSVSSPTILIGSYSPSPAYADVYGYGSFALSSASNVEITNPDVTVTPEPSSFALLGTGLLVIAGVAKRRYA